MVYPALIGLFQGCKVATHFVGNFRAMCRVPPPLFWLFRWLKKGYKCAAISAKISLDTPLILCSNNKGGYTVLFLIGIVALKYSYFAKKSSTFNLQLSAYSHRVLIFLIDFGLWLLPTLVYLKLGWKSEIF